MKTDMGKGSLFKPGEPFEAWVIPEDFSRTGKLKRTSGRETVFNYFVVWSSGSLSYDKYSESQWGVVEKEVLKKGLQQLERLLDELHQDRRNLTKAIQERVKTARAVRKQLKGMP